MNSTGRFWSVIEACLMFTALHKHVGAQELAATPLMLPIGGSYYSLQTALEGLPQPPLPFNPFPDLPLYQSGTNEAVLFYDDRSID